MLSYLALLGALPTSRTIMALEGAGMIAGAVRASARLPTLSMLELDGPTHSHGPTLPARSRALVATGQNLGAYGWAVEPVRFHIPQAFHRYHMLTPRYFLLYQYSASDVLQVVGLVA